MKEQSTAIQRLMLSLAEKVLLDRNAAPRLVANLKGGEMTTADRQAVIDVVAEELCQKGFDFDSEPTAYGSELERLIDYLNRTNIVR